MLDTNSDHDSAPRGDRATDGEIDPGVENRTTYVGSSDVAALVGLDSWRNVWDVFNQKLSLAEPTPPTPAQEWGNRFERCVAEWFEETRGVKLLPGGFIRRREYPFCAAHPDRTIDGQRRGVEIKIVGPWMRDGWGEVGTDRVPLNYLAQVNWCMWLTGFASWDLVPFFWGEGPRVYTLKADPELQQLLADAAVSFWRNHVETGTPPPLDGTSACATYLRRKYPTDQKPLLSSTPRLESLAARLREVRHQLKAAQAEKAGIENEFKAVLQDAAGIEGMFGRITWRANKNKQRALRVTFNDETSDGGNDDD